MTDGAEAIDAVVALRPRGVAQRGRGARSLQEPITSDVPLVGAWWTVEHRGHVVKELKAAVERAVGDQIEHDIGVVVVDPIPAGPCRDL